MKNLAKNRRAFRDYQVLDKYEAGIKLLGSEVKSVKKFQISLKEAYVRLSKNNQAYLIGAHIAPYKKGSDFEVDRDRKILLNKSELLKLANKVRQSSLTIIPIKAYLKRGLVKIEIGLVKRKAKQDMRQNLIKKAQERDIKRELN